MKISWKEKKVLYVFGCPDHHNTVTRLKWLTALTVDPEAKDRMLELARKIDQGLKAEDYAGFYHRLRRDMDNYRCWKRQCHILKTSLEEDLYEEAV